MNHVKWGRRKKKKKKKKKLSLVRSFAAQTHLGSNWIKKASRGPGLTWALICGPLFPVNGTLPLSPCSQLGSRPVWRAHSMCDLKVHSFQTWAAVPCGDLR